MIGRGPNGKTGGGGGGTDDGIVDVNVVHVDVDNDV